LVQTLIGAIGTIYTSRRSRVRIHARANVRTALHIQRWRPNGWTDQDPNWYKHSLGQSAQVMGVGVCVCEAREYMNGTWRCSGRERDTRVCGARTSWSKKMKKVAESQRVYMNGICREHETRVCGARSGRSAQSVEPHKKVAESQTDSSR
jgi:hypothetical protein